MWDSDYAALEWPERRTTVLTIEAPPISRYWRATTLDVFNGDYWLEIDACDRSPTRSTTH